jgi:hypothetical protein
MCLLGKRPTDEITLASFSRREDPRDVCLGAGPKIPTLDDAEPFGM